MQLYHPRFSMYTLAPRWYSDRMTHGHFLPVYSRIPGPVTLYTQSIQSYQDTAEHMEYHHFYGPNQKVFFSPIWYHQSSVLPLPNVAPKQAPGFSHHEMPSEAWPEGFRGELRWGETPESARRQLRASRICERGSEAGVWHLPQQVICEDQLSERGVFSLREPSCG